MTRDDAMRVFGLYAGYTAQDVDRVWKVMIKSCHPDQSTREDATEVTMQVNECRRILKMSARSGPSDPKTLPKVYVAEKIDLCNGPCCARLFIEEGEYVIMYEGEVTYHLGCDFMRIGQN